MPTSHSDAHITGYITTMGIIEITNEHSTIILLCTLCTLSVYVYIHVYHDRDGSHANSNQEVDSSI